VFLLLASSTAAGQGVASGQCNYTLALSYRRVNTGNSDCVFVPGALSSRVYPLDRFAYVANGASDDVSVVDVSELKEVTRVPVGSAPKRNITVILPR
jgi:YVTN family beta-propeller protein